MRLLRLARQRGVTLVELLAVLGLLAGVVTLVFTAYSQFQEIFRTSATTENLLADTRLIQRELANAIRQEPVDDDALPGSSGSSPPVTFALSYASGETVRFSWNPDHTFTVEREDETFTLSERVAAFSYTALRDTSGVIGYRFTLGLDGNGDGKADADDKHDLVTTFSVSFPAW